MEHQNTVSRQEWLDTRKTLLAKEKEFTRLRDELSTQRRELPREKINKDYVFEGVNGPVSLSQMFGEQSQLAVFHFMFGTDWQEGCPSCSFWADNFNGTQEHLIARDIKLSVVSRGPLPSLLAYKNRMGWTLDWYSSADNEFNVDFAVSFDDNNRSNDEKNYNFETSHFSGEEAPGFSFFYKDQGGTVYRTYSTYSRGLDMLNSAYQIMDMAPKGRDEDELPFSMAWLRRRDQYTN